MKRYFTGAFALTLAIGFNASTKLPTPRTSDNLVFTYNGIGDFQSVILMEHETNWYYEGTTEDILLCDAYLEEDIKGCQIVVDAAELNIDNTPSLNQSLSSMSSEIEIDAAKPTGQTYAHVVSANRFAYSYSATVANQPAVP